MNEDADLLAELEEENIARGEEIAGSYLRRCVCTVCHDAETLATPEWAPKAICGTCLAIRTGYGAPDGSVPYSPAVGYPRGVYVPHVIERLLHPPPVVTSRDKMPAGVVTPGPVTVLAAEARSAGWSVLVQYAVGTGMHGTTGRPTSMVTSWAVRARRGTKHVVAVYAVSGSSASWSSVWIIGDVAPYGKCGITELKEYIVLHGDVLPEWFDAITEKRAEQEQQKKIKAACDAGKHEKTSTEQKRITCAHCGNSWDAGKMPWRKPKRAREHA